MREPAAPLASATRWMAAADELPEETSDDSREECNKEVVRVSPLVSPLLPPLATAGDGNAGASCGSQNEPERVRVRVSRVAHDLSSGCVVLSSSSMSLRAGRRSRGGAAGRSA